MLLLAAQRAITYDPETKAFDRRTPDGETLTARLYELVRFLELD